MKALITIVTALVVASVQMASAYANRDLKEQPVNAYRVHWIVH